jgi:hypothetical protein
LSWFGTPEFGQGIAWFLDLALLVAAGLVGLRVPRLRRVLAWSCLIAITLISGSMVHTESRWWLAPFLFYDALAFYGLFAVPLLLLLFAPKQRVWQIAIITFGLAVILISGNRTALVLSACAAPIFGMGWWLTQVRPAAVRMLFILGAGMAPLATTAAVYLVGDALQGGSLWSRMLHLEVARLSVLHDPALLLTGGGWGSYGEWQIAHLPVGQFDLVGQADGTSDWDAVRGELHFQSHNFLVEALLSGGVVAMILAWLSIVAIPIYCARRALVLAGTTAIIAGAMLSVWAPDAGMVPYIALTFAALANPRARFRVSRMISVPASIGLLVAAAALAASTISIVSVGRTMSQAAHDNRDTVGLSPVAYGDCADMLSDQGRGGVHLASLYRNFSLELGQKKALGTRITEADAARLADYICLADHHIGESASLRLANADLLVTGELLILLDDPILAPLADDRLRRWRERLLWFLQRAPTRSDVAVTYLNWQFANGREAEVSEVAGLLLARNRQDPIGLWFSGAVMMGVTETAADGFDRMRRALDLGLEKVMPVDQEIAEQIRSAPGTH